LEQAEKGLMASPGHRRNILNKWHRKVSLGIAYDKERLDLVQHFEGDYIDFSIRPTILDSNLSMTGNATIGIFKNVTLHYDPLPQPLSLEKLSAPPYDNAYGLGEYVGVILSPPSPGYYYTDLSPNDVVAITWDIKSDGSFSIKADASSILGTGNGVYTVVLWVDIGGEYVGISNYSMFIN
ncbi:CAP domain-containing protein, partial [Chloroflexota bacterium]